MPQINKYTKDCISKGNETANFIDTFFYNTDKFKGSYKRTKTYSYEDRSGIDVYEVVDGITKSIDEKAYISSRGVENSTFALETTQTTVNLTFDITYQNSGWLLQNKHYDENGCKKNDYYNFIWINKLKDGKSDKDLKDILKKKRNGLPHKPEYTITGDDYLEVECALVSVENLYRRFVEIGISTQSLTEGTQKCFDKFLAMCKKDNGLTKCSFAFNEIFGVKLQEGYEGKWHGKNIYFTASKIPIYDEGKVIGYSMPVNIIIPKEFYLSVPGCEHRIIKAS